MNEMISHVNSIPVLQRRVNDLKPLISDAEQKVTILLKKYKKEALDIERLQNFSIVAFANKITGKYDEKVLKEEQEMLIAKLEYDKANERYKELREIHDDLCDRISRYSQEKSAIEEEMARREALIKENPSSSFSDQYNQLIKEQNKLSLQLVEVKEAITAASRVMDTLEYALDNLRSAREYSKKEIGFNREIGAHTLKYEHIDRALSACSRLNSQINILNRELDDINIKDLLSFDGLDTTNTAMDQWFEHFLTELNVKGRIENDYDKIGQLKCKIYDVLKKLDSISSEINDRLQDFEGKKIELMWGQA
jgi:hypothetical protein